MYLVSQKIVECIPGLLQCHEISLLAHEVYLPVGIPMQGCTNPTSYSCGKRYPEWLGKSVMIFWYALAHVFMTIWTFRCDFTAIFISEWLNKTVRIY